MEAHRQRLHFVNHTSCLITTIPNKNNTYDDRSTYYILKWSIQNIKTKLKINTRDIYKYVRQREPPTEAPTSVPAAESPPSV